MVDQRAPRTKGGLVQSYMEPEVWVLAIKTAEESAHRSVSGWVRELIIKELVRAGKIDNDMLLRLASG